MKKLAYKIGVGVTSAALLFSSATTIALADVTAEISGNGADSNNTIYLKDKTHCTVYQKNSTWVSTDVNSSANTGGNKANGNTGGDVAIDTGNATSQVTVTVEGGSNSAENPCCCTCTTCDQTATQDFLISGNGEGSTNAITTKKKKSSSVTQKNKTSVTTGVSSKAKTGKNKSNDNTGGTVGITTGDSESTVDVLVTSSSNTLTNP